MKRRRYNEVVVAIREAFEAGRTRGQLGLLPLAPIEWPIDTALMRAYRQGYRLGQDERQESQEGACDSECTTLMP